MSDKILLTANHGVAVITINRERALNALDDESLSALESALRAYAADATTRVIVLTGSGTRAFSAGSDIKELARQSKAELAAHVALGQSVTSYITEHPCVIVAAIEGHCVGGGLELALACDVRVAGQSARFGLPEVVNLNALPSWGGTFRLAPLIGTGRAREMILLGRKLTADEALAWGLVNHIAPQGEALAHALQLAKLPETTQKAALAIAKGLLTHGAQTNAAAAHYLEYLADQVVSLSAGFDSSIQSFGKKAT